MKSIAVCLLLIGCISASWGDPRLTDKVGVGSFTPEPELNARTIGFSNGISVDTRQGEPALPPGYRSSAPSGVYLVQFSGPIQERWVDELLKAGAVVYSYFPNFSYTVRMDEKAKAKVQAMKQVAWVGIYHPAYKVAESQLFRASGSGSVVMMLFPDADIEVAAKKVQALGGVLKEKTVSRIAKVIRADLDLSKVVDLANLPEVMALHSWPGEPKIFNNHDQWVIQQGHLFHAPPDTSLTYRPIWWRGIRGQGQLTGQHDSGINFNVGTGHCAFRDPSVPITAKGDFPTHRKVVAYKLYDPASGLPATFGDGDLFYYHGTHTCGTTAGNDTIANGAGPDARDGMAKDARLNFTDIGREATGGLQVDQDMTALYDTVTRANSAGPIKQHSGSWGWSGAGGQYLTMEATTDAWHWRNKLVVPIFSAGNDSLILGNMGHPGNAKNVLTVGGSGWDTLAHYIYIYSSCGPTQDGRVKPTVMAPAVTYSSDGATACSYVGMGGTSMSCPGVNGALVLVRQYFQDGWYPLGKPRSFTSMDPSAALMRAMAICSADSNVANVVPPSPYIGFGRIDLDSVLYFDTLGTDARKLAVVDNRIGYWTGWYCRYIVNVADSTLPLRVTLAWVDTAAAVSADPTLVNDLDLELMDPYAVEYRGNQISGWRSTPNPGTRDNRNVEEIARIVNPRRGDWLIRVRYYNTPNASQLWFGLVVTGGLGPGGISGIGEEKIAERAKTFMLGKAVPNPTTGKTRIEYALPVNGNVALGIYNVTGQLVRELVKGPVQAGQWAVTWDGRDASARNVPGGVYFYKLTVSGERSYRAVKKVVILK
jgi:hypothetical protein